MTAIADTSAISDLPLAPANPLSYRQRLASVRDATVGVQRLCAAGGPVTRVTLGPKSLTPTLVYVSSPQGARRCAGASRRWHRSSRAPGDEGPAVRDRGEPAEPRP